MPPILPALRLAQWRDTNFGALQGGEWDRTGCNGEGCACVEVDPHRTPWDRRDVTDWVGNPKQWWQRLSDERYRPTAEHRTVYACSTERTSASTTSSSAAAAT
jgi:hypothetical protein